MMTSNFSHEVHLCQIISPHFSTLMTKYQTMINHSPGLSIHTVVFFDLLLEISNVFTINGAAYVSSSFKKLNAHFMALTWLGAGKWVKWVYAMKYSSSYLVVDVGPGFEIFQLWFGGCLIPMIKSNFLRYNIDLEKR